jgi:hypothetical protein
LPDKNINEYASDIIKLVRDMTASENDKSESLKIDRLIQFIEDKDIEIED